MKSRSIWTWFRVIVHPCHDGLASRSSQKGSWFALGDGGSVALVGYGEGPYLFTYLINIMDVARANRRELEVLRVLHY